MQLFDLKGKTAIITGASSGLGEQFAHCLSGAGARVLLAAQLREVSRVLSQKPSVRGKLSTEFS